MSKIQITKGSYDETCTVDSNLTENAVKFPAIRDVIQYSEQRMLSTLIVAGASDKSAIGKIKTKIGEIPKDRLIGNNAYRYPVQGRIQQQSIIVTQIGASGADGSFTLQMSDNYLYPGMVAVFNGNDLQARVMGDFSGTTGNYVYNFQTMDGTVFDWNTHVANQSGTKTCFGSYTSYSDKSPRGYGRSHYADMFINHMTLQRKTIGIAGGAGSTVLWLNYNGQKGWMFEKERQARLQFMMEDEFLKWFGRSTMKDSNGNLLAKSRIIDPLTGEEVIVGDGFVPQIEGINETFGSASDGSSTMDDVIDMMTVLVKKCNVVEGKKWYIVTGTDGGNNLQKLFGDRASNSFHLTMYKDGSPVVGGQEVEVGYNFKTLNVNGNQVTVVIHPLFDDEKRFTQRGSDGKLLMSSKMVFLDLSTEDGQTNIEILGKGAYGIDRTMVSGYINGITGMKGKGEMVNSVDAIEFNMLKEDGGFIYNTASCGIINKSAA